ncbi:hypothetical protein LEMLEM_LOCUS11073, partial [Lemmus lemmus]
MVFDLHRLVALQRTLSACCQPPHVHTREDEQTGNLQGQSFLPTISS